MVVPGAKLRRPLGHPKHKTQIAERESTVADLERRLAEDWNNVETLAAHRHARDELQALLQRWETAFERAQT